MSKIVCPEPGSQLTIGSTTAPITSAPAEPVVGTPRTDAAEAEQIAKHGYEGFVDVVLARQLERELDRALFDLNQEIDLHEKAEREVALLRQMVDECHGWLEDTRRELTATRFLLGEARGYLEGLELADRIDILKEPKND